MLYVKFVSCSKVVENRFLIPNSWKGFYMVMSVPNVQLNHCWNQTMGNAQGMACVSASGISSFLSYMSII